jgi:hypothetical protein
MATVHAGPIRERRLDLCAWVFHFEDADLYCSDRAIPGGTECADHLIQRVQLEDAPRRWTAA